MSATSSKDCSSLASTTWVIKTRERPTRRALCMVPIELSRSCDRPSQQLVGGLPHDPTNRHAITAHDDGRWVPHYRCGRGELLRARGVPRGEVQDPPKRVGSSHPSAHLT